VRGSGSPYGSAGMEVGLESNIEDIGSTALAADTTGIVTPDDRGRYVDDSLYQQHALYGLLTHTLATDLTLLVGARLTLVHASAPRDPLFATVPSADAELDRAFFGAVGSLGLRYDVTEALTGVLSLLGGFRAPNLEDFQAFGGGARGFTIPNQDLSEERSWTLEAGVELDDKSRWQASAYVFASLLDGMIVRVPGSLGGMAELDGEPVLTRENASTGLLVGSEASLLYRFESGLYAGPAAWLTWGEIERPSETSGDITEPASKIPGPTGVLRVGYATHESPWFTEALLTTQLTQRRLSEGDKADVRLCANGPERCNRVAGYTDLTLRGGVHVKEQLMLTLAIENILDRAYKTYASGAYAPGRNFVLALRGTLD
jgi:hemoglobin/transferrin/lactoferrin receptor protein